jgi:hypothetical protein
VTEPADLDALAALPPGAIDFVTRLHDAVDSLAGPLAARLGPRLRCARGCAGCCVDELSVFEVEAAVIVRRHRDLLDAAAPRVYAERPYVCRTQGLPLRWLEEDEAGAPRELRDECPLNGTEGPPIEALPAADCFTLGPFEERLAALQARVDGGQGRRVALRSLFRRASSGS